MNLRLVSDSTQEPLTVDRADAWLRLDTDCEGGASLDRVLLESEIRTARLAAESRLGRPITLKTYDLILPRFPAEDCIRIPMPPLRAVESVKYFDEANVLQTLAASSYIVSTLVEPGRVSLLESTCWPCTYRRPDAVRVRFRAGMIVPVSVSSGSPSGELNASGHWFEVGDSARYFAIGGDAAENLESGRTYTVSAASASTLRLADTTDVSIGDTTDAVHVLGDWDSRIELAMRQMLAHWFENREAAGPEQLHEVPMTACHLLDQVRFWG